MFAAWGAVVYRRRRIVIFALVIVTVLGGAWGFGVFGQLSQGGYTDTASQSALESTAAARLFGKPPDVVVVYSAPPGHTVSDPAIVATARSVLRALPVAAEKSYWDTGSPGMVSVDHRHALAAITLRGPYSAIEHRLAVPGLTARVGGPVPLQNATNARSRSDLTLAEAVSLPVTLVLLVLIFGSLLAAALPVLVGALAILGSLGVLRLIALTGPINGFAPNVVSLLGLGLAIDYGLFTVGRFREELAAGRDVGVAVARTVATSGRTVAFSATLLVVALSTLLVFPIGFLRSLAYGGMSAVAVAALVSVTLLPALLGVLGHRLAAPRRVREPGWLRRLANVVLRRPVAFAVPIVIVLVALAWPLHSVRFGAADEKQLPPGDPTRQAVETIDADFPADGDTSAQILLPGPVDRFVARARTIPGVADVVPGPSRDGVTLVTATLCGDPLGPGAMNAVPALRGLDSRVLVGGFTATVVDSTQSIVDGLPLMIGILVAATLVLMFLAFRSVLLPVKAVLLSTVSLGATFGVLVWVFQLGHGSAALDVTPQPVQPAMIVLIGAVVFGLSTDYETFLLSRMVEARANGASTPDAIRAGLTRTGRMISSAALLLIVVTGAFGLSELATMRFLGVGMIVALVIDATVVRLMLVPAVLRLVGAVAWWPGSGQLRQPRGPRLRDQLLDAQRHGEVEHERGIGQATACAAGVVEQRVQAEVHADRDDPQRDGQHAALSVHDAALVGQPDGERADVGEDAGGDQTAEQDTDADAADGVVPQVVVDLVQTDDAQDDHQPRSPVAPDRAFLHLPCEDEHDDQHTDDDADQTAAVHDVHHVRSCRRPDQSSG